MADLIASTSGPQIEVVVELADDLPPAMADPNQLEMAILNLGVNARDAMPEGGTLTDRGQRESVGAPAPLEAQAAAHYVRLSVADTGVGMDEATLARAVEPFFSTKGIGKGTGLGLSMVHGLAAQLGGALTIEQPAGRGHERRAVAAGQRRRRRDAGRMRRRLRRRASEPGLALLVDDEDLVRVSTADMLADLGYEVVEAASAEEALAPDRRRAAARPPRHRSSDAGHERRRPGPHPAERRPRCRC